MIRGLLVAIAVLGAAIDASAQDALSEALFGYQHDTSPVGEAPSVDLMSLALPALGAEEPPCDGVPIEGEFVLDRDVSCGVALATGATLDLNGFTLEGSVWAKYAQGAIVRNGTIVRGRIQFEGCSDCVIENVRVIDATTDPGDWWAVQTGPNNRITGCFFSGNETALDLFWGYWGNGTVVEDSTFENNNMGINDARDSFNVFSGNSFRDNRVAVRLYDENSKSSYNTIVDNHFSNNDIGVYFKMGSCRSQYADCLEGNQILRNEFVGNGGSGVLFDGTPCEDPFFDCGNPSASIEDNVFSSNGFSPPDIPCYFPCFPVVADDGISLRGPANVVDGLAVASNLSVANSDLGIEAPGAIDGGGNRASGNGNPIQCVGVACMSPEQCQDGIDNDGDGRTDFRVDGSGDLGCKGPTSVTESPQCQDGLNNDNQAGIDFDGGASVNGGVPIGDPDPQCVGKPWLDREIAACGLGAELALVMPLLGLAASRKRRAAN